MLTLYGSRGSGSAAVEMALRVCGLPYRVVPAASWEPESDREGLARINPLGLIPVLVLEDGTIISESAAILIHLGLEHPETPLLPAHSAERARSLRGLVYLAANCYAAIGIIDYPQRWTTSADTREHEQVRGAARSRLYSYWETFADVFATGKWLAGSEPGALDYLATVISRWAGTRAHLQGARGELYAMLLRIDAHASVAPVLREHWDN